MILNRANHGSPSVLLVLWRALRVLRPMEKARLVKLCAPETVVPESKAVENTLRRWTAFGLFEEKGGKVYLAEVFDKLTKDDGPEYRGFRREVRRLALSQENNQDFVEAAEPKMAGDFTLVAAWVLSTDVFADHFLGSAEKVKTFSHTQVRPAEGEVGKDIIGNTTRWDGFKDWARFLGFARTAGGGFRVDVTDAIDDELDGAIPTEKKFIPVQDFVREIGKKIPVLDGGEYAVQARNRAKDRWKPIPPNAISPALTLALLRLERAKRIELEHRADASNFRELLGRGLVTSKRVSHIRRLTRGIWRA